MLHPRTVLLLLATFLSTPAIPSIAQSICNLDNPPVNQAYCLLGNVQLGYVQFLLEYPRQDRGYFEVLKEKLRAYLGSPSKEENIGGLESENDNERLEYFVIHKVWVNNQGPDLHYLSPSRRTDLLNG